MVELSQRARVEKHPIFYKHFIEVTYPKENVQTMMKSWKDNIEDSEQFLQTYEENRQKTIERGHAEIEEKKQKDIARVADLLKKPKEELLEHLYEEFQKEVKSIQQNTTDEEVEKRKKEFTAAVEEQLKPIKQKAKENIKEKKEALQLWENAEVVKKSE